MASHSKRRGLRQGEEQPSSQRRGGGGGGAVRIDARTPIPVRQVMKALMSNSEAVDMPSGERATFQDVYVVLERKKPAA